MSPFLRRCTRIVLLAVLSWTVWLGVAWSQRAVDLSDPRNVPGWRPAEGWVEADQDQACPSGQVWVSIDALPDHVWQAFVAAEDPRLFERWFWELSPLAGQITRPIHADGRHLRWMLTQISLGYRLQLELTRRELLELWLNTVFLGRRSYGVEEAALAYFGVSARELDVGQAALIASMVPAPSRYARSVPLVRWRRALVLQRMVDQGWLDPTEAVDFGLVPVFESDR